MGHADAGLDRLRKGQRRKVVALRLNHQPHEVAGMDVERALLNQKTVHGRVKPAVINHVVDVTVDVVVRPAGADLTKHLVGTAGFGDGAGHGGS